MPEVNDWNQQIIEEFRTNAGQVGGNFAGASMVLVHHTGRTSGHAYVNPMTYMPDEHDPRTTFVFATKSGAPTNPDWYYHLTAAGEGSVKLGTDVFPVTVRELTGDERDRNFAEQARRYPGFAEYAEKTAGIRTIALSPRRRGATCDSQRPAPA